MEKIITVIAGDGIGPEVTNEAIKVLNEIAVKFKHRFFYQYELMGAVAIDKTGDPLPGKTIDGALNSDAVLLGAIGDPKYDNDPSAKVRPEQGLLRLRKSLNLYTNIRPVVSYPSLQYLSPLKRQNSENVDLVIYRELTGGIYFGEKTLSEDGQTATDLCKYEVFEIERIARLAFKAAMKRRRKLTLVDKANVLETSRLWRRKIQEMHKDFPEVELGFMYVDNAAMQLVLNPKQFDVILTENMFGDILSDESSVISGSVGLLPSSSIGDKALFEPIHGSYPQAAGRDIANPVGSILSVAMMLDYFGLTEEAHQVRKAVEWTMKNGFVTADIDPVNSYTTSTVGDLVTHCISNELPGSINTRNLKIGKTTII